MLAPKAGEVEERDNSRGVWCEGILGSRLFLRHGFEWQCALHKRPARANKLKSPDIWELAICLPGRGKLYCQRLQSDRASKKPPRLQRLGGFDAFPERNL